MKTLVAFTGLSGAGKDTAAKPLIARGFRRVAFGDAIKDELDPMIRRHFGFSAFTEDRDQKRLIRRTLEAWGEDNYPRLLADLGNRVRWCLSEGVPVVNTRLVRLQEAVQWRMMGGVLIEVEKPGVLPATQWEADRLQELRDADVIDFAVLNSDTQEALGRQVLFGLGLIPEGVEV